MKLVRTSINLSQESLDFMHQSPYSTSKFIRMTINNLMKKECGFNLKPVHDVTINPDYTKTSMYVSRSDRNVIFKHDICYAKLSRSLIKKYLQERNLK